MNSIISGKVRNQHNPIQIHSNKLDTRGEVHPFYPWRKIHVTDFFTFFSRLLSLSRADSEYVFRCAPALVTAHLLERDLSLRQCSTLNFGCPSARKRALTFWSFKLEIFRFEVRNDYKIKVWFGVTTIYFEPVINTKCGW